MPAVDCSVGFVATIAQRATGSGGQNKKAAAATSGGAAAVGETVKVAAKAAGGAGGAVAAAVGTERSGKLTKAQKKEAKKAARKAAKADPLRTVGDGGGNYDKGRGGDAAGELCRAFQRGGCTRGDGCPHKHDSAAAPPSEPADPAAVGGPRLARRAHRTVVLPGWQGVGVGSRLSDAAAEWHRLEGCDYTGQTVHPRFGRYRDDSPLWHPTIWNH